jgi:hypothetical protein
VNGLLLPLRRCGPTVRQQLSRCKRIVALLVCIQNQQKRGSLLHDTHPCMPMSMNATFVALGLTEPSFEIQVVLRQVNQVLSGEQPRREARHDAGQVLRDSIVPVLELVTQRHELSLAFRHGGRAEVQCRLDAGYVLGLLTDFLLDRSDQGQTPIDAVG